MRKGVLHGLTRSLWPGCRSGHGQDERVPLPELVAEVVAATRVLLTPLRVPDAADMVIVLADPALYRWTGGAPPTLAELERQYQRQASGPRSATERWVNWVVRRADGQAVGYVQATVTAEEATLAWVIGSQHQGRGYATEAVVTVMAWLAGRGVSTFAAQIAAGHHASEAVAAALGLHPTDELDSDGERVWRLDTQAAPA